MRRGAARSQTTPGGDDRAGVNRELRGVAGRYAERLEALLGLNLVSIVLYGSVARKEATPGSDVDLLVVCESLPEGRFARLRLLEPAEHALHRVGWRRPGVPPRRGVRVALAHARLIVYLLDTNHSLHQARANTAAEIP